MPDPAAYTVAEWFPEPDFPLYVTLSDQPQEVPHHTHDFVEVVLVAGGEALQTIAFAPDTDDDAGAPSAPLPGEHRLVAGDVFAIAPGERHTYRETKAFLIYNVMFLPGALPAPDDLRDIPGVVQVLLTEPVCRREDGIHHKLHLGVAGRDRAAAALETIARECRERRPGSRAVARGRLAEFLVLLGRATAARTDAPPQARELRGRHSAVERAVAHMEAHFAEALSLDELARSAFLSPHYFCESFKQATGLSPFQYLAQVRIEEAKRLLDTTRESVTAIACSVGFSDSSYFARVFRAAEGLSPSAYRKRNA